MLVQISLKNLQQDQSRASIPSSVPHCWPNFLVCELHSVNSCHVWRTVLTAWTCCCVQLSYCQAYNFMISSNALYNQHICDIDCCGLLLCSFAVSRHLLCMLISIFSLVSFMKSNNCTRRVLTYQIGVWMLSLSWCLKPESNQNACFLNTHLLPIAGSREHWHFINAQMWSRCLPKSRSKHIFSCSIFACIVLFHC